ncbi:MAG: sulfotransferase [Parvibaculaceae bacterium]
MPSSRGPGILWDRIRMTSDAFREEAMRLTGLSDFGDPAYAKGLDVLMQSLRATRLNFRGRLAIKRHVLHALKQRLLFHDLRKTSPGIFATPLLPPIIVAGLPRSGTTILHRLLAQDERLRAPLLRELLTLVPSPSRVKRGLNELAFWADIAALRFYSDLDAKHVTRLNEPEECMAALATTFRSPYYWLVAPTYFYLEWYGKADRRAKYREYHAMLKLLQSRAPEKRLLMKSPEHLGSVAELLDEIPEALVVVCYRKPEIAITSQNNLTHPVHRIVSKDADPARSAEATLAAAVVETQRYMSARDRFRQRIVEVDYDDIVRRPLDVVARVFERAGLPIDPEQRAKFERFLAENPKDKHGRHVYRPEDFGQTAEEIARRMAHYRMAKSSS